MSLDKQTVSVVFTQGVDSKTDEVVVDRTRLQELENYSHTKRGTLARRDAWVALPGTNLTGLDTQAEVFALGRELLAIDSSATLKTYAPGATAKMPSRGAVPNCSLRKDRIHRTGGYVGFPDSATWGGMTCFVWRGGTTASAVTGIYCSVIDESTGALVVDALTVALGANVMAPRVCVVNGYFVFAWVDTTGPSIYAASMAVGGTTIAYAATAVMGATSTAYVCEMASSNGFAAAVIVFDSITKTNTIGAIAINEALSTVSVDEEWQVISTAELARANVRSLCLAPFGPVGTSPTFAVAVGSTTAADVWACTLSYAAGHWVAPYGTMSVAMATTGNSHLVAVATSAASVTVFGSTGGTPYTGLLPDSTFTLTTTASASAVTTWRKIVKNGSNDYGPHLIAKPFLWGGAVFVPVLATHPLQPTLFILDALGNVVARCLDGVAGARSSTSALPSVTVSSDGNVFSIPALELGMLQVYGGAQTTQQGVSRIRVAMGRTYATADQQFSPLWHAEAGGEAYLSGGFLAAYDGAQVAEAGFHLYPEGVVASQSASGSNPNGAYYVCAVYEWVDGQGRRHQSAPSLAVSVTTTNKGIDMTCPTLQLGVRKSTATIAFYRTLAGGTTFYRDSPTTTPIANSLTAATVSYTSDVTDAALSANEILYSPTDDNTAAAELFHDAPPACRAIWSHQGRLFVAGLEDEHEYRYSQLPVARQGLAWANTLSGRIPEGHGGIVAGGVLDDKVVLYTPTRKFVMVGEGPNMAGSQGSYSTPQLILGDVGCVDQRSVALVPDASTPGVGARQGGLLFQSRHGLYLTDRALGDQYVGYPVEHYSLGGVVSSAVTLEDVAQLRMTLSTGEVLVYDHLYGQWGISTNSAGIRPVSACVWNGLYTLADSASGLLLQESPDTYRDLSRASIVGRLTTAWFKTSAIDGFQRVWRFFLQGLYRSDSRVDVVVHANYDATTVVDAFSIPSTAAAFGDIERQVEMRFGLAAQKCTAIRFTITDTPNVSPWKGAEFSGITLEVGVKPGTSKRAPMQANSLPAPTGQLDFSKPGNSGLVEVGGL